VKKEGFIIVFFVVFTIGFFACKKDASDPLDLGYNYFPDDVGRYVVYNVDSFYYDDFNNRIDTTKFQLKEKIQSIFTDNQGRPAIRLERYVKYFNDTVPYASMSWQLRNVWTETKTKTTAEKVEENVRYVKLVFPVNETQRWDGNAQNTLGEETYKYNFFGFPRTVGNIHFDSVLQVDQQNEENLLTKKYYIEKYAKNVGLIYKQIIDVESQPDGVADSLLSQFYSIPIMNRVDAGVNYTWTITSYGKE
jgi:hypothetical protein